MTLDSMQGILVATDFSQRAAAATQRAAQLSAASGARLALVHVVPFRPAFARIHGAQLRALDERLRREAARLCAEHGIAIDAYLAKGAPHAAIAALASAARARLVVMGLRGGFARSLLGFGMAQRVHRSIRVPVLAVRHEPRGPYRRILAAADLSPPAERALSGIAGIPGDARLHLLHVCPPGFEGRLPPGPADGPDRRIHHRRAVRRAAKQLWQFAHRIGLGRALLELEIGEPAARIRERAVEIDADLLVVVPARKSRLASLIFGSVTGALLPRVACDVLLLDGGDRHAACVPQRHAIVPPEAAHRHLGLLWRNEPG